MFMSLKRTQTIMFWSCSFISLVHGNRQRKHFNFFSYNLYSRSELIIPEAFACLFFRRFAHISGVWWKVIAADALIFDSFNSMAVTLNLVQCIAMNKYCLNLPHTLSEGLLCFGKSIYWFQISRAWCCCQNVP